MMGLQTLRLVLVMEILLLVLVYLQQVIQLRMNSLRKEQSLRVVMVVLSTLLMILLRLQEVFNLLVLQMTLYLEQTPALHLLQYL